MIASHPSWQHSPAYQDRRGAPRRAAQVETRLRFSASPVEESRSAAVAPAEAIKGYTRDISETGLAILVTSLRIGDQYLNTVNCRLRVTLELPEGAVQIDATPVRCEQTIDEGLGRAFLIGLRIRRMDDSEWVRLVQYVSSLG